jgi:TRAP-type C4-dicarboxylate transport system permease small subunit
MFVKVKKILDRSLEFLTAFTMAVLVVDVTWQVFTRFIMKDPSSWTEELATFLLIWVGLLGSSVALHRHAHLGIDFFVNKLPERKWLITRIVVFSCTAIFSITVLVIGGLRLVTVTLATNQVSPALGIKMGYVYLALPISGFFLTMYSLEFLIDRIFQLIQGEEYSGGISRETITAVD